MSSEFGAEIGPHSPSKQSELRRILGINVGVVQRILAKSGWAYPYYTWTDLNAGPGEYYLDDGTTLAGSPRIFAEIVTAAGLQSHAHFCEQSSAAASWLGNVLRRVAQPQCEHGHGISEWHLNLGDHADTIADVRECFEERARPWSGAYGVIYADPNGTRLPVEPMRSLAASRALRFVDCLAYISATNYKRVRAAHGTGIYLEDDLRAIGKRFIWLREPVGRHQWTFVLMTNWARYPHYGAGWYRLDTPEGQAVMDRLNLSQRERDDMAHHCDAACGHESVDCCARCGTELLENPSGDADDELCAYCRNRVEWDRESA